MALVRHSGVACFPLVDSCASASYHVMPGSALVSGTQKTRFSTTPRECHHAVALVQELDLPVCSPEH